MTQPEEQRRLGLLDQVQPLLLIAAIGVGLGLGAVAPTLADALVPLVSIGVFVLIYLVMIGVDLRTVAGSFANRRFLVVAVLINFVVNPLVAWGLAATFLSSHPDLWAGLVLFLVTPCIGWYLIFTELADGDAALGVTLLGINVVLQIALLPLYVFLFAGESVGIELGPIVGSIGLFLVLPLGFAAVTRMGIRRTSHSIDDLKEQLFLPYVKTGILAGVIISMFASQADEIFENPGAVLRLIAPITCFFAIAFGLAIGIGWLMGFSYEKVALLVFTASSRNSEASLAIAATAFSSPLVALTVVMGPVIELPLLVLMVRALLVLRPRFQERAAQRDAVEEHASRRCDAVADQMI